VTVDNLLCAVNGRRPRQARALHPRHGQPLRRQCARRVRSAARDLLSDRPVRDGHEAIQRLPKRTCRTLPGGLAWS